DLDAELRRGFDQAVEDLRLEAEQLAGRGGEGVGAALLAGDEAGLAEDVARLQHAEGEGAVGGGALDGDLAPLEHVEIAFLGAMAEDQAPGVVHLLARRLVEAEDLIVGEVGERPQPPQARGELELPPWLAAL